MIFTIKHLYEIMEFFIYRNTDIIQSFEYADKILNIYYNILNTQDVNIIKNNMLNDIKNITKTDLNNTILKKSIFFTMIYYTYLLKCIRIQKTEEKIEKLWNEIIELYYKFDDQNEIISPNDITLIF